jgi:2-succinyl-6-hydroxy-2,4-cyclohexadiene-1-carboxylate synthase
VADVSHSTLHAETAGRGPRIVLVHGFTQSSRCWGPVLADLVADHEVCALDAPGHGRSSAVECDLPGAAARIGDTGGRATYLGYSMGGRFVLRLALDRPELVERLVLVGATAGIDDADERAERRRRDEALADRLLRDGVERFLDEWLAQPLFASLPDELAFRAERAGSTAEGLASSLRRAGTGAQEPVWDRLGGLGMPVLAVAGAHDHRFAATARRMADAIGPSAELAVVPGAGHAAHLEQPTAFLALLRAWLDRHPSTQDQAPSASPQAKSTP